VRLVDCLKRSVFYCSERQISVAKLKAVTCTHVPSKPLRVIIRDFNVSPCIFAIH